MRSKILKAVVVSLMTLCFSATLAFAEGIEVTADTHIFRLVVTNTSKDVIQGPIGISSYTEEYTIADGEEKFTVKNTVELSYSNNGQVEKVVIFKYEDNNFPTEVIEISDWEITGPLLSCHPLAISELQPGKKAELATFDALLLGLDCEVLNWKVHVVVSDLYTGSVLREVDYTITDNSNPLELQLISQKLDSIIAQNDVICQTINWASSKIAGISSKIDKTDSKINSVLSKIDKMGSKIGSWMNIIYKCILKIYAKAK